MPQQYVELAGVKKVLIGTNANSKKGSPDAAYAWTNGAHDTIVMNFGYYDPASVYEHETFHEVNSDTCDGLTGMDNDPTFSNNNTHSYDATDKGLTYQNFWNLPDIATDTERRDYYYGAGQDVLAQPYEQNIDKSLANVSYLTDYSQTNPAEDKAETGKAMSSGDWDSVDSTYTPLITNKFKVLLARVYQHIPQVAKYFALTSTKN